MRPDGSQLGIMEEGRRRRGEEEDTMKRVHYVFFEIQFLIRILPVGYLEMFDKSLYKEM
jgi:hypothetical protein